MNTQHQPKASNGGFRAEELGRRQFQKMAVQTIDLQAQAIAQLQAMDKIRGEFMADMSVRVDDLHAKLNGTDEVLARVNSLVFGISADLYDEKQRSFWQRLRWLFTGK